MADKPEQMRVVIAGGAQSAHAYWMEVGKNTNLVSRPIRLPSKWSALIDASETDLGSIPAD
jgi:hypothetical protein